MSNPPPGTNWFFDLFGFVERDYNETQRSLQVQERYIKSQYKDKWYHIGTFETKSVGELKTAVEQAYGSPKGSGLKFGFVYGDITLVHAQPEYKHATFQAASQFNCLEFINPSIVPEDGITMYVSDKTQGPACAISCGAGTAYRNYLHKWRPKGESEITGQTGAKMINTLDAFSDKLGRRYFDVQGGYMFATNEQLRNLNQQFPALATSELKNYVKVGVHSDVQVTSTRFGQSTDVPPDQIVTQVLSERFIADVLFCSITAVYNSACSIAYNSNPDLKAWEPLSRLILEASYEACLYQALLNAHRYSGQHGSRIVVLTLLGGGAFGNDMQWILEAIVNACTRVQGYELEVRLNLMHQDQLHPADKFVLQTLFGGVPR